MIDLKGKRIFVMTNTELGWDCVTGVYLANSEEDVIDYLREMNQGYDEDCDIIQQYTLEEIKTKSEIRDEKIEKVIKN